MRHSGLVRLCCASLAAAAVVLTPALHAGADAEQTQSVTGHAAYTQHCASCHGPEGGGYIGPAVIGPEAALGSYGSAQGLLDYISSTMPQDRPGALDATTYRQVLAFLLIRNGVVPSGWDPAGAPLGDIALGSK